MQRYTDEELSSLLDDLESELAERKESFNGDVRRKAREAVCAFANDLPNNNKAGVLFIGARDDGSPSNLEITDQLLQSLGDMKTDGNILPLPVLSVEKRVLNNSAMAVVTVMPSDMPPIKYDGRIWIRVGSRRAVANEQEERILTEKRRYRNIPYDLYPVPTATIQDISKLIFEEEYLTAAFASDVLESNGRTYEQRLASCRMIASLDNPVPTISGLLAIGKNPQDFLYGAYIQFLRIDGSELADPVIDEEDIGGTLTYMLRTIDQKLSSHNRISIDIVTTPQEIRKLDYPPAALQQIIYNAIMHRTYERTNAPVRVYWFNDRIEIHSPGGPYGNVTPENFGAPGITDYRNPTIAEILKVFGFVQRFGRGIATARRELDKNGNPPLQFEVTPSAVLCIIRRK